MMIDRALGDDELLGNLAVGQPLGDQERHLLLAGGEQLGSIAERWVLLGHGDEIWSLALLFFREGVLYGRLQPDSPPLCQRLLPRHLSRLRAGGGKVRLAQRRLLGCVAVAYCFAERLGRAEQPGRPLDFSFGCRDASQPLQALRGNDLVTQLFTDREPFFVVASGPFMVSLQQCRPSQVVEDNMETVLVSPL